MTLIRRVVRAFRILEWQQALIVSQQQLIHAQQQELHRVHLDYTREMEGIVAGWLINLEQPEIDVRHDLAELSRTLSNRAAQLEEHVVD